MDKIKEIWIQAAIFFIVGIIWRLPFQSKILHEWDSVNFALALDKYDLRLHQPHPPGMFFLYILSGRLFNFFLDDPNASLVWVSTIATGFAAATIFILGQTWFGRQTGSTIALLMLSSPLIWFQGEVALSYMLEFFWVLLIVWGCYHLRYGNKLVFFSTAIFLGLAGGIRPNTPFFLFPLWAIAVFLGCREHKYKFTDVILAVILGLISVCVWLIPMVASSGGIDEFWQTMQPWLEKHPKDGIGRSLLDEDNVSSLEGVYLNFKLLLEAVLYGIGFGLFPLIWWLGDSRKQLKQKFLKDWRWQTLLIWLLPGLIYLIFVHIKRLGHSFTILPVFIIIAGIAIAEASKSWQKKQQKAKVILPGIIFLGNILFFTLGPANWQTSLPTWETIIQYDRYISERVAAISRRFSPTETMVLTTGRNGRIREFYLAEYSGTGYDSQPGEAEEIITLPENIRNLVLFEDKVLSDLESEPEYETITLPSQATIRYLTWDEDRQVKLNKYSLSIEEKNE
ncbi:ArnT family glycosyltransferase [Oscillatoria salina]|uniref:ArnT family glycosyltransferase n=1 Tax=Oscillatoria salina TaxID=331517 RepID=UPI0013BAF6C9|nr:hypothetical protein [Oscillatoria salina]MBZ8179790.1 hypothetical protein [Oscillatoria salina IIICB1]NET87699.1 hypothetical protein [Kamptonema sp. SIO1D9]